MTWNTATPAGTDLISQGDDVIREFKSDVENSLLAQDVTGVEAVFPGADAANPVYRYRGLRGLSGTRPTSGDYGLFVDTTRNVIQRDNGATWDDVATLIPVGTVMVFYQAAAPVGWTKITTDNDKALRVVSGTGGGAGGSVSLSTSKAHTHTVSAHHHSIASAAIDHRHKTPVVFKPGASNLVARDSSHLSGDAYGYDVDLFSTGATLTDHSWSFQLTGVVEDFAAGNTGDTSPGTDSQLGVTAYIDVIVASKD